MANEQHKPGQQAGGTKPATAANATKKEESKADKFKRLGNYRTVKAVDAIKRIGHLSGSSYDYTPDQVAKLKKVLTDTVANTMARFDKNAEVAPVENIL